MATKYRSLALFCLLIALVAGATAATGVLSRGDGSKASAVSIRGERFEYMTTGVYAYNPERVVAEGVGWDVVTLAFAVPVLLIALPFVARGSLRGRLVAVGILGYLFYQYLMYAVFWAFGPLFVPFIVIYSASAVAVVWMVSTIDVPRLPEKFTERFPGKTMAVVSAVMGLQLVAMWAQRISLANRGEWAEAGMYGMPAMAVQAMDLGMIVPLALATAVFAWRKMPWGYLLATVFAVKGVTMAGAICAMLVSAAFVEGRWETIPLALFGFACAIFGALAWRIVRSIEVDPDSEANRHVLVQVHTA